MLKMGLTYKGVSISSCKISTRLVHGKECINQVTNNTLDYSQNHAPTTLPPLVVIKMGSQRLPIWPAPPSTRGADLPPFCLVAYRATIKNKFIIHFHQYAEIPVDAEGTHLTATEIHEGTAFDMYTYCQNYDLSQVWAYMWNCWYSPKQWPLWARSAAPEIPHLKTTMVSEAQWKVIKHNDLGMFNRPRLDLVVHMLIMRLLPRVRVTLATILGDRCTGRAALPTDWQNEFRAQWIDMSKPDELRNIQKQLAVLRTAKKSKRCAEKLTELEADAERPSGSYHTDVNRWRCSCPSYLISRFLLCKHIVRTVNTRLQDFNPKDDLAFFTSLRRNHLLPFYYIPRLHNQTPSPSTGLVTIALPAKRVLRNLEDVTVVVSGPTLAANKAKGVYKEGVTHEETPMADDGSIQEEACEQIPNIVKEGNSVLTESEDSDNEDQVCNLRLTG